MATPRTDQSGDAHIATRTTRTWHAVPTPHMVLLRCAANRVDIFEMYQWKHIGGGLRVLFGIPQPYRTCILAMPIFYHRYYRTAEVAFDEVHYSYNTIRCQTLFGTWPCVFPEEEGCHSVAAGLCSSSAGLCFLQP